MSKKAIYRGYEFDVNTNGRYFISKDGREVYSMTTNSEEDVYDWIDREIRRINREKSNAY